MEFRNPETGEVLVRLDTIRLGFCSAKCKECAISYWNNHEKSRCDVFCNGHPHEAARLMGYEVVEDDREGQDAFITQTICRAALDKWGKENQTRMIFEEMAELQKELCKEARGENNTDAIAEEIADVKIMLEQMIILHNCKDMVEMQMKRKLQRLKERLEEE